MVCCVGEFVNCSDGSTPMDFPTTGDPHPGYTPSCNPPAPAGVMGSALIQRLLPSRFSVGASWNRMNAGYEPETTTQGLHIVSRCFPTK